MDGHAQFGTEFGEIIGADVPQLAVREIVPDAFIRMEVGRVPGELRQVQPSRGAPRQEVLDDLRSVDGCSIPDDEQQTWHLAEQMLEKAHDSGAAERTLLHGEQPPAVLSQAAHHREVVVGERGVQERSLAAGGVGADPPR